MFINNIDIKKFGAKQLVVDIQNSTIKLEKEWIKDSLYPFQISSDISFKKINVELYFIGENRDQILKNISNLLSLLKNLSKIEFENYSNSYYCYLNESQTEKTIRKDRYKLNISFEAYEVSNEKIESLNRINSKTINVSGNLNTPAIVEIIPSIDIIDIKLEGLSDDPIIIKNLKAGQKVIINGEDGIITCGGINKFDDSDMWEFPRLVPGSNTIKLSKNSCDVTIKYKSRWI